MLRFGLWSVIHSPGKQPHSNHFQLNTEVQPVLQNTWRPNESKITANLYWLQHIYLLFLPFTHTYTHPNLAMSFSTRLPATDQRDRSHQVWIQRQHKGFRTPFIPQSPQNTLREQLIIQRKSLKIMCTRHISILIWILSEDILF